ncbi:c-5 sterol desaturase [Mortierella sp. GBA30]|nr:c-5 sterol desaturase [Mortierella sp. GBA30]
MDVILDKADEYILDATYKVLPAIPIPDLVAGLTAIPHWSELPSLLTSTTTTPLQALLTIARNVASSSFASHMTLDTLPTDHILRQSLSLLVITYIGALVIYFVFATTSYFLVFDQNHTKHPKYLKNQIKLEIEMSMRAIPGIAICTLPWFLGEVRGWSRLYETIYRADVVEKVIYNPPTSIIQETVAAAVTTGAGLNTSTAAAAAASAAVASPSWLTWLGPLRPLIEPLTDGWGYIGFSIVCFLLFTDWGIYWIHRLEHHPLVYKHIHKPHHRWIVPTPFSSHAFHFLDGYLQSTPYHAFVYLMPMNKYIYLVLFVLVNLWSVMIHDGEYLVNSDIINSAAHHAVHHLYFNYNYGQYFTLWDRIGGSHRKPSEEQFNPKLKMNKDVWKKQSKEVDNFDDNGKPTEASDASFKTVSSKKKTTKVL